MKRVLSVLVFTLALVACAPAQTKADLVAPTVANDFFAALCSQDAHYLATHTGGALVVPEEYLVSYFAGLTKKCVGYRYLGSLQYSPNTGTQYVYVISWGPDGELWYVLTIQDGVATNLE